jgi:hypothetical protein
VTGVDQFPPVKPLAFEQFLLWDDSRPFPSVDLRRYDYVLMLDIIELLKQPEQFLDLLRHLAATIEPRPTFIATSRNIVFAAVRLQALLGNFNYGKRGILDLTYTRLDTFSSLKKLFEQCSFEIEQLTGIRDADTFCGRPARQIDRERPDEGGSIDVVESVARCEV